MSKQLKPPRKLVSLILSQDQYSRLDNWRRKQTPIPTLVAAIRHHMDAGLNADELNDRRRRT